MKTGVRTNPQKLPRHNRPETSTIVSIKVRVPWWLFLFGGHFPWRFSVILGNRVDAAVTKVDKCVPGDRLAANRI